MARMSRRAFLSGAAAGAAAVGAPFPAIIKAQSREIAMLGIFPFTGVYADAGPLQERGMKLALAEWDNKVIGRPIKYVSRDDETSAGAGTRRAEEAIDSEGVKFIIGPYASSVALAVTEVAKRRKVLHYFSGGTEEITGRRCHRYGFNWAASPYTAMHILVEKFMQLNPNAKRWYVLGADYSFGRSVDKYLKIAGRKFGVDFVHTDWVTLGTREFSGFVTKAASVKPDVVFLILFGHEFVTMVRELHNFGLAPTVAIIQASGEGSDELSQLDAKNRENLWQGTQAYYALSNPVARRFAETYEKQFSLPPGYRAITAYGMTRLVLRGIERANSAEPADVVRALEGWETEDWPGKVSINAKTHQTVRDVFVLRCKPPAQMRHAHDYAEVMAVGSTPLMPDDLVECKDIGSL